MVVELGPHQVKAVREMHNGSILTGGVGTGKSRTGIAYYYTKVCGGMPRMDNAEQRLMSEPRDLYIITTPKKRNDLEWEEEAEKFALFKERNPEGVRIFVDSWNNIAKYVDVENAFFIFDEQRLVGSGAWVKSFYKIAKANQWIILSATPGDTWMDYVPVFVANGFFKNRTEFQREHVVYSRFSKFPKVERYLGIAKLERLRASILVDMPYERHTNRKIQQMIVDHDGLSLEKALKERWHIYEERPLKDVAELFALMRKIVNSDPSRLGAVMELLEKHPRLIVFYNFNYELDALRALGNNLNWPTAEWNGHKHQPIPDTDKWLYLVQCTAGAEGWNCITTNAICFYSLNYSYKVLEQSMGRIDRLNTPFKDLYYYILRSDSKIDTSIWRSVKSKKTFNENAYAKKISFK